MRFENEVGAVGRDAFDAEVDHPLNVGRVVDRPAHNADSGVFQRFEEFRVDGAEVNVDDVRVDFFQRFNDPLGALLTGFVLLEAGEPSGAKFRFEFAIFLNAVGAEVDDDRGFDQVEAAQTVDDFVFETVRFHLDDRARAGVFEDGERFVVSREFFAFELFALPSAEVELAEFFESRFARALVEAGRAFEFAVVVEVNDAVFRLINVEFATLRADFDRGHHRREGVFRSGGGETAVRDRRRRRKGREGGVLRERESGSENESGERGNERFFHNESSKKYERGVGRTNANAKRFAGFSNGRNESDRRDINIIRAKTTFVRTLERRATNEKLGAKALRFAPTLILTDFQRERKKF